MKRISNWILKILDKIGEFTDTTPDTIGRIFIVSYCVCFCGLIYLLLKHFPEVFIILVLGILLINYFLRRKL